MNDRHDPDDARLDFVEDDVPAMFEPAEPSACRLGKSSHPWIARETFKANMKAVGIGISDAQAELLKTVGIEFGQITDRLPR